MAGTAEPDWTTLAPQAGSTCDEWLERKIINLVRSPQLQGDAVVAKWFGEKKESK
jgi:hypothetical protein